MGDISEDAPDDLEGLDASAAHVANLLSTEPAGGIFLPWELLKLLSRLSVMNMSTKEFDRR